MAIALNPALDPSSMSEEYAAHGRLQIRDFFTEETAESIHKSLYNLPWYLAFNDGDQVRELTPEQLQRLSPQQRTEIQQRVYQNAQTRYQFLYNHYPLFAEYFRRDGQGMDFFRIYEFINSPKMLAFFRELTGIDDICWADGHATLFQAGHFLKFHTDEKPEDQRVAAYVLSFSKDWGRDWGGLLQFWDKNFDVEKAYRPVFNALNIFTVPADHSVSVIAPYCPGQRFSITGWLRADQPPGLIKQR